MPRVVSQAAGPANRPEQGSLFRLGLIGPMQDDWLVQLQQHHVQPIQYLSDGVYLSRITSQVGPELTTLPFVRNVTAYTPTFSQARPGEAEKRSGFTTVTMAIYDDGQPNGSFTEAMTTIENLGGIINRSSRLYQTNFITTIQVTLPTDRLSQVTAVNALLWLDNAPTDNMLPEIVPQSISRGQVISTIRHPEADQTNLAGTGVVIALIDTGFDTGDPATVHPDLRGHFQAIDIPSDEVGHGTHVGGIIAGNARLNILDDQGLRMGLGMAPEARLLTRYFYGTDQQFSQDSVQHGATISNHSYVIQAAQSGYTSRNRAIDGLVRDADPTTRPKAEPLTMVFAAGNFGKNGLGIEAKNIIVVGSTSQNQTGFTVSSYSGRGPTVDGRVLPQVVAPGQNIISTATSSQSSIMCNQRVDQAPITNPTYALCSGTSMAAPYVSGTIALLTEWWQAGLNGDPLSPAMAKALLVNGADDLGQPDIPNPDEGWGQVSVSNILGTADRTIYRDQIDFFTDTSQLWDITVQAVDSSLPVKITLAWTDAPGAGLDPQAKALVNDLDLVVKMGNEIYWGNHFVAGKSVAGGVANRVDNLENIFLETTDAPLTIEVIAANLAGDGIPYNNDLTDQDFALIIQNAELVPLNFVAQSEKDKIMLSWETIALFRTFRLSRATTLSGPYQIIYELNREQTTAALPPYFVDSDVQLGINYYYRLEVTNQHGSYFSYGPLQLRTGLVQKIYVPVLDR